MTLTIAPLTDLIQILNSNSETAITAIRANLATTGTNASGSMSKSLRFEVKETGGKATIQIIGQKYFTVVETGRKPTPGKKPSRAFVENIKQWQGAKNVGGSAYAIALTINKEGSKLWQKGGRKDIYSDVFPSFIESIQKDTLDKFAQEFLIELKNVGNSN